MYVSSRIILMERVNRYASLDEKRRKHAALVAFYRDCLIKRDAYLSLSTNMPPDTQAAVNAIFDASSGPLHIRLAKQDMRSFLMSEDKVRTIITLETQYPALNHITIVFRFHQWLHTFVNIRKVVKSYEAAKILRASFSRWVKVLGAYAHTGRQLRHAAVIRRYQQLERSNLFSSLEE